MGRLKPKRTHVQQGVVISDSIGTHLGYNVFFKAIEIGLEIVLRIPHLSFVLQGEDIHGQFQGVEVSMAQV